MADVAGTTDWTSLFSNPLFMGGVQGLLSPNPNARGQAFMKGMMDTQTMNAQQQQMALNRIKLQQATNAANFNPQDYMQTAPSPVGTNAALGQAPQMQQMPATLGGPMGGAMPMNNPAQMPIPAPTPGTPTGQMDIPSLLAGTMQAGGSPQEAAAINQMMDPVSAARMALASKFEKLSPGEIGVNGLGQQLAVNGNAPISDPAQVLARTQAAAAQARASGNLALADQLDASVQKQSGAFDQQMRQATMDATQAQRDILNQNRQEGIDLRKQNQELVQGQREQNNQFQVQRQATVLTNQLEKSGIPQAQNVLDNIKTIMAKYPEGQLPGYGVVEGMKPMWALSQDGQQLRQAVAQLANINLKARSGVAVTQQEFERFKNEMGNGSLVPESRLRQGIQQMGGLIEAQKKNFVAGTDPDVVQAYEENGGMPLSYLNPRKKAAAAPASISIDKASAADIAAAIARKKAGK